MMRSVSNIGANKECCLLTIYNKNLKSGQHKGKLHMDGGRVGLGDKVVLCHSLCLGRSKTRIVKNQ